MARYEGTMELITLIRILSDLRIGKTTKKIAEDMGWHLKKTQNTLKMLKQHTNVDSQFDLVCGENENGAPTYLIESESAPRVSFSENELAHLEFLVKNAEGQQLGGKKAARDLIAKIRSSYPNILAPSFANETEPLLRATGNATRPGICEHINQEHYELMSYAVKKGHVLEITNKNTKKSLVCPLGFLHGISVYLVYMYQSQIDKKAKPYIMRISNVETIAETDEIFDKAGIGFDLAKYASRSFGVYNDGNTINVTWEFDKHVADEVAEYQFHPEQTETKLDNGNIRISFSSCSDVEMFYELFKWGNRVKIIEPTWFAEKYQAFLRLEQDRWEHENHFKS